MKKLTTLAILTLALSTNALASNDSTAYASQVWDEAEVLMVDALTETLVNGKQAGQQVANAGSVKLSLAMDTVKAKSKATVNCAVLTAKIALDTDTITDRLTYALRCND